MRFFTAEYQLLRLAARFCLGDTTDRSGGDLSHGRIDWNQVLWLGREEGVLLLLHHALRHDLRDIACPNEIRAQLDGLSAAAKLQDLARTAAVCRLHDAFSHAGIPFFVVDAWMFQTCFHPDRTLIESVAPIRCLLLPENLTRARSILLEAGFSPAESDVQIASLAQSPVECVTNLTVRVPGGAPCPPTTGKDGIRLPGGRLLRQLAPHEWLPLLAEPWTQRTNLPLFPAFQLSLLASRVSANPPVDRPPWIDDTIAASHATLHAISRGHPHREFRTIEPAVVVPPACPFLPTPAPVIERMLTLADVGPNDTLLDLGCGDGAIVVAAARRCGSRAIGIDCDPSLVATAKTRAEAAGVSTHVSFVCGDLFAADFAAATVVCLYLAPAFYGALQSQILARARPGTRIVSHDYFFSGWSPLRTELVRASPTQVSQIFVWRVP